MEIANEYDDIYSRLWDGNRACMQNCLLRDYLVFQCDSYHEYGDLDSSFITICALSPIYIMDDPLMIKEEWLDYYSPGLYKPAERTDIMEIINNVHIYKDRDGRAQIIDFPDIYTLARKLDRPKFGTAYIEFYGAYTYEWLQDIYETFIRILRHHITSGELLLIMENQYFAKDSDDRTISDYQFFMRNNYSPNIEVHNPYYELLRINELNKHLTHRMVKIPAPTDMDIYNVF